MTEVKQNVVILGGGIGGASVAKALEDVANVTLVDPKDYFEVPYAGLRLIVEPKVAEKAIFLHSEYLKKTTLVRSSATSISDTEVSLSDGVCVPYDYLIIATGSTFTGPASRAERVSFFETEHKRLVAANSVLIVGGGPVGVELAGEIVTDFPDKKVTLVHGGDRLIDFIRPKAGKKALDWLVSKKVEVILNDRVEVQPGAVDVPSATASGKPLSADTLFVAIGKKVGSGWLHDTALATAVDADGRLKVNATTLAVEGKENVFAVGDITNIKENKQGYYAAKHAEVVVKNIKTLIKSGKNPKPALYKSGPPMGIVSLGRKSAVADLPFGVFLGKIPALIKSKDLFVSKTRKDLGLAA